MFARSLSFSQAICRSLWLLLGVGLLGGSLQVVPFLYEPTLEQAKKSFVDPGLLDGVGQGGGGYTLEDHHRAVVFGGPGLLSSLATMMTILAGLGVLYAWAPAAKVRDVRETTDAAGKIVRRQRWMVVLGFFIFLFLVNYVLSRPQTLMLFRHHQCLGMINLTFMEWIVKIKVPQMLVSLVKYLLNALFIFCMIKIAGDRWWSLVCPLVVFLVFSVLTEIPLIKAHEFDLVAEIAPLPDGPYREQVEAVARREGVDLELKVEDASKRENKVNIYLSGRAADRFMVFTDTFLEQFSPVHAAVAAGHELRHVRHDFVFVAIHKILTLLELLLTYSLVHFVYVRKNSEYSPLHLFVLLYFYGTLLGLCFQPLSCAVTRYDEFLADRGAVESAQSFDDFVDFLIKAAKINRERLEYATWVHWFFSDHPSMMTRLRQGRIWWNRCCMNRSGVHDRVGEYNETILYRTKVQSDAQN